MTSKRKPKLKASQEDLDAQFDAFLKESFSSEDASLDTARVSKYLQPKRKKEPSPWWMEDADEDIGLSGTGKSFLKSKKDPPKTDPEPTQKEDTRSRGLVNGHYTRNSHDSLDEESFGARSMPRKSSGSAVPALSLGSSYSETTTGDGGPGGHGLDTLAEIADKKRFFEDIEKNSDSTIDYSRLNRDLDKSATLGGTLTSGEGPLVKESDEYSHDDPDDSPSLPEITARRRSSSEPPADDEGARKISMLSKVALQDSLDSTLGTKNASNEVRDDMQTIPEGVESQSRRDSFDGPHVRIQEPSERDKDTSDNTAKGLGTAGFGYTNTSREIEELHQALKQVGMSTLTGDYTLHNSSAVTENTAADGTQDGTDATGFGLKPMPRSGSEERRGVLQRTDTVEEEDEEEEEEGEEEEARGFMLSPVRQDTGPDTDGLNSPVEKYAAQLKALSSRNSSITTPEEKVPPKPAKRRKDKAKAGDKYNHVRSSGYGLSLPPRGGKDGDQWSPAHITKQKVKGSPIPTLPLADAGEVSSSQLLASVQSFASYIQDHFTSQTADQPSPRQAPEVQWSQEGPAVSSSLKIAALDRERALQGEVKEWQAQWREERKLHTKLKADMESFEREVTRKLEEQRLGFQDQIFKLKQENYVLNAKVSETDNTALHQRITDAASAGTASEDLERLEKEVREQEQLLAGYHTENERLYNEMKKLQTLSKTTEEKMFRENEKLRVEVNNLREKLDQKEMELKSKGIITSVASQQQIAAGNTNTAVLGAGRIAQLDAELKQAKRECESLKQDINMVTKEKKDLEKHIQQLVSKVGEVEKKTKLSQSAQSQEVKDLGTRHAEEVEKLQRKLKWYAQNQDLLDQDLETIQKKDAEIKTLKERLTNTQAESGSRQSELRNKTKERAADARRIQDLERQVKEMEGILRKRNPNSLPVLMWAASNAPADNTQKPASVEFLEKRVAKLEAELDTKDDDSKKSLRAMEQKFNAIKFTYEERIEDLENRLGKYERPGDNKLKEGEHPHSHLGALQKELDAVRERHKKRVAELEHELEQLKNENQTLKTKEAKAVREAEAQIQVAVKQLEEKVANQDGEKQLLQRTVERLQKEKQQLSLELAKHTNITKHAERIRKGGVRSSSVDKSKPDKRSRSRSRPSSAKSEKSSKSESSDSAGLQPYNSVSSSEHERQYQPQSFAGLHIEDVLQENEELKVKVERLQFDQDQQRVHLQGMLAQAEAQSRRAVEEAEEKVMTLRSAHQQEFQRLLADQALQNSTSAVMELQSRTEAQQVMISHLKQQLADSRVDGEQLATLRIRETTLETEVQQLLDDLADAKKNYTPEMRHFESLHEKLKRLESRHAQREAELQQIIDKAQVVARVQLDEESGKWQKIVTEKNREIEHFRAELDTILGVLRELHRQGVVIPVAKNGNVFR